MEPLPFYLDLFPADGLTSGNVMALAGQALAHWPHFEHSGMKSLCGSSFSGHAFTHARQSVPSSRRQSWGFTDGRKSRLPEDTRDSRALTGQNRVHHFRKSVTSSSKMTGNTTKPHVVSLKANRCQTPMRMVNVRPIGHTRQKTGNLG